MISCTDTIFAVNYIDSLFNFFVLSFNRSTLIDLHRSEVTRSFSKNM